MIWIRSLLKILAGSIDQLDLEKPKGSFLSLVGCLGRRPSTVGNIETDPVGLYRKRWIKRFMVGGVWPLRFHLIVRITAHALPSSNTQCELHFIFFNGVSTANVPHSITYFLLRRRRRRPVGGGGGGVLVPAEESGLMLLLLLLGLLLHHRFLNTV